MNDILVEYDRALFLFLNGLNNSTLDFIMFWVSDSKIWTPFYLLLLYFLYKEFGFKGVLFASVMVVIAVALADQASVNLFKNVFMRYRPSHNLEIKDMVHIVNEYRGGMYGFVSSHAANSFVIATTVGKLLRNKNALLALWLWAALISYSRIYLGVHYPLDLICGGFLGISIALLIASIAKKLKLISFLTLPQKG